MAVQVNPIAPSLPATTAIQDPATRRFAQAVEDALRALRSEEGAVESLKKAADAMNNAVAGGTPPSIAQWLFSSELYQKLTTEIARVDVKAKQDLLAESMARSAAIAEIQAALAEIESVPAYDAATTYALGDLVTYDNKLYRAKGATTGNLPTNTTYWDKVGDYASLGDVVAAHTLQLSEIESDITDIGGDLAAEITARDTLATQLRGTYTGTDVAMVSQGLLYSERQARVTADGVTVSNLNALRAQVGVTEAGALTEGFILNEQTIRNTNDLAIVSAVNTALAQITGVSTSISQSGQNLIANWSQAQATKWSQIESEVLTSGGQTIRAALQQEATTRANADGSLGAQWTLKTDINGYISGFGFASTANNATPTSAFVINADRFVMTMPGYGEHVPFAIGPSGAEFTGLTNWANVQSRPSDAQILNNLLDTSSWTGPSHGGVAGFIPNGSDYEQYRRHRTLPDGSQGISWFCYPGLYHNNAYGWDNPQPGSSPAGDADGGWNTTAFPITSSRGYRFSVWVCHTGGDTGTAYLGCGANSVRDMGGGAVNNNPYFVVHGISGLITDRWYLFVGYVHPENRGGEGQTSLSGIYDGTTGAKVASGTDYCWAAGATTSIHRAYLYYAAPGSHLDFVWPRVDMLNGMEPSLAQLLAMGSVSARNPITPSNVTTYIANAAIGNAQIGGDIWSTNHVAGASGWRIYRDGNAEFRNVTVRGDVEASSLKANTAMVNRANIVNAAVDTLQIAGNAVTIPVAAYTVGSINASGGVGLGATVQSAYINPEGGSVIVIGCVEVTLGTSSEVGYASANVFLVSPSGAIITSTVATGWQSQPISVTLVGVSTETGVYTVKVIASSAAKRALVLLGAKR